MTGIALVLISSSWMYLDGAVSEPSPPVFIVLLIAGLAGAAAARGAGRALGECLAVVAVQAILQVPLTIAAAHLHHLPALASILAALFGYLGIQAGTDGGGVLLVEADAGAEAVAPTFELAAISTVLRLLAAMAVVRGIGGVPAATLTIAACGIIRVLAVAALIAGGADVSIGHEPHLVLFSFLPFAPLLAIPGGAGEGAGSTRWRRAGPAAAAIGGIALGLACGFRSPGRLEGGRVLIDESRSDWEWTRPAFEHGRYGQRSLYSYSLWAAWIRLHYDLRVTASPPSIRDLEATDVLIIKTPTRPYDEESIASIERFVSGGGGLLLIGDHTNLFGMSTVLNAIAKPYGIAFRYDDTFPLEAGGLDIYSPPRLIPHPVLRGIDRYPFETSCTLQVPWTADHIMIGGRLGAEPVDYGHPNFFGNIRLDPSDSFGLFVQAAAVTHGAGRVAAFTDSTNFSNFSLLWEGRRRLTLNLLDWLNRETPSRTARRLLLAAGLVCLVLAPCGSPRGSGRRAAVLWTGTGLFLITAFLSARWSAAAYPDPAPIGGYRTIAFDTEVGAINLEIASPVLPVERPGWLSFNDLFINTARSGLWPVRTTHLATALERHDAVVIVNPRRALGPPEIEAASAFLERGGRLLVLDSILNSGSPPAPLPAPFGLSMRQEIQPGAAGGTPSTPVIRVSGQDASGERTVAGGMSTIWRDVGEGRIVLAADASIWSDRSVGGVYATPDENRLEVYAGQRDLFRILLEDGEGREER